MVKKKIQQWKKEYLNIGPIVRLVIILAITIWLNFFVFTTPIIPTSDLNKTYVVEEETTYLEIPKTVSEAELNAGNLGSALWDFISIFSKTDKICFENKGSYVTYGDKIDYDAVITSMSYNKGELFEVNKKECRNLPSNSKNFTFIWAFRTMIDSEDLIKEVESEIIPINSTDYFEKWDVSMHPHVATYIAPSWTTKIIKFVFIFFSVGTLLWAWSRTFFLIRYGWDKKQ